MEEHNKGLKRFEEVLEKKRQKERLVNRLLSC